MFSAKQMFTNLVALVGWRQTQKLLASDLVSSDWFGASVSISRDGSTLLIGAEREDTSPYTNNGAAYVFTWDGTTWTEQAKLTASDLEDYDLFGWSVSLSDDGNTLLIGAPGEDTSPYNNNGAAYVFTRSGTTWTQQAKLLAGDRATNDEFGYSVSLSDDGNTALVGAHGKDTSPDTRNGAAYVFTRSGTTWTQQAKLLAGDRASDDRFGWSVAISADGNTAIIGARNQDTSPYTNNGAAYVFTRSGTTWTQQAKLLAGDGSSGDQFGWSVSISGDGNTLLIGASTESTSPYAGNGAAYVFTRSGTTWTQQAKLLAGDRATNDEFGYSVSLSDDGNTALIGASSKSGGGASYVFTWDGSTWTEVAKLLASDRASSDLFGASVAISGDGDTALIGASRESTSPTYQNGAAYIFVNS